MATGGNLGGAQFTVNANILPFQQGMNRARQQAKQTADAIGQDLKQGSSRAAMGLLEVSRAVEDLQYGFSAIVNNIPGIVTGLGLGTGVAGAASLAAVGINQLVKHWGDLTDAMQAAWSGSTIEQLRKIREGAEAAAESFEKLAKAPSKAQEAQAKSVEEMIAEAPFDRFVKGMRESVMQDPALKAQLQPADAGGILGRANLKAMRPGDKKGWNALIEEAKRDILDERNEATVKDIMGKARLPGAEGDRARATMDRLMRDRPQLFPAGARGDLQRMSPEAQQQDRIMREFAKQGAVEAAVAMQRKGEGQRHGDIMNQFLGNEALQSGIGMEKEKEKELNKRRLKRQNEAMDDMIKEEGSRQKTKRHLTRQVRGMLGGLRDLEEGEKPKSEFVGLAEFSKRIQTGAINNQNKADEIRKRQLEVLERIKELMEDNPQFKGTIQAAVAAGPN